MRLSVNPPTRLVLQGLVQHEKGDSKATINNDTSADGASKGSSNDNVIARKEHIIFMEHLKIFATAFTRHRRAFTSFCVARSYASSFCDSKFPKKIRLSIR